MAEEAAGITEGRLAATWQNKAAGRALRGARLALSPQGAKQAAFAAALGRELGMEVSPTALSGWETGRRAVPAAVLLAAALSTDQSLDGLLGEAASPQVVEWAETLGLLGRISRLEAALDEGRGELRRDLEQLGRLLARIVEALDRAGLWSESETANEEEAAAGETSESQ